jgi:aryl-alcohol dehydrogenase-like predicted oxidoreductase
MLWQGREKAASAVAMALAELETDYLDLFLIHWPGAQAPRHLICRSCVSTGSLRNIVVDPDPLRSALVSVGWFRIQRRKSLRKF